MTEPAIALRASLERHGMQPWLVSLDVEPDTAWEDLIRQALTETDLMVLLLAPGDEDNPLLQFEIRQALAQAWSKDAMRIAVVASAVRAIPKALRHQPFVSYFNTEDVRPETWASSPGTVDKFIFGWLNLSDAGTPPISGEEIRHWRNVLLHLGSAEAPSPEDRSNILRSLRDRLSHWQQTDTSTPVESFNLALECAAAAEHLNDGDLATAFYTLATWFSESMPSNDSDLMYSRGLAQLGAGQSQSAVESFSKAAELFSRVHGPADARTVAAQYNWGLALSRDGDRAGAMNVYRVALDSSRRVLGEYHPQTAAVAFNLAQLEAAAGNVARAVDLLNLAQEAYSQVTPAESDELQSVGGELERLSR